MTDKDKKPTPEPTTALDREDSIGWEPYNDAAKTHAKGGGGKTSAADRLKAAFKAKVSKKRYKDMP